jgi:predicted phosphodiesterase
MKLAVLSDLHLETSPWDVPARTLREADVIVLAGDIGATTHALHWARQAFPGKRIIYVAGNHEFYGAEIHGLIKELRHVAAELYIDFLEKNEVIIHGENDSVRFLGTTLWTDFQLFGAGAAMGVAMHEAGKYMLDFDGRIRFAPMSRFRPTDSVELHRKSRDWLAAKLDEPFDGKTVVVTHHAPSMRSIAARFATDPVSAAFGSNLDDLVAKANLWIHGHTHTAFRYQVGPDPERGHVVCNPRGYRRETYAGDRGEKTGWHPRLLVDTEKLCDEISAWQQMPDVGLERVATAQWICDACVELCGLRRESVLSVTAHLGKCDVCGKEGGVMSAGEFS